MKTRLYIIALWLFAFALSLAGCAGRYVQKTKTPAATVTAPGVSLVQSGDSPAPAAVESNTAAATLTFPAGTEVVPDIRTGGFSYRLMKDAPVTFTFSNVKATGPAAFVPPAPPTASETAVALSIERAFAVGGVLALAALALAYFGHGKAAGVAFLGALAVPAAARFIGSTAGLIALSLAGAGSFALFVAWYVMEWRKKRAAAMAAQIQPELFPTR